MGVDYSTNFDGGVTPENYTPNTISDVGSMVGKIAHQVIREVSADDRLAVFDKMPVDNGDTIEQAIVKLAESYSYDKDGLNALTRKNPEIAVRMFKDWTRATFKQSVDIAQIRKVLTTGKGASELATKIISSLNEGDKQEKYEALKSLLEQSTNHVGTQGFMVPYLGATATDFVPVLDGKVDYGKVLLNLRNMVSKMSYVNAECNKAGLKRKTLKDDIVIIMPYQLKNGIDVEELSGVFNLDKAEIKDKIIEVDIPDYEDTQSSYSGGKYNYIWVVDKNAILSFTRLYEMVDQINADGLFWNYFLHVERMYGVSPLFDAMYLIVQTEAAGA